MQCAEASATPLVAASLASMADINGKKRQWFRRHAAAIVKPAMDWCIPARLTIHLRLAGQSAVLCGSAAQEAVSPWRENPLWWRFESAQRELDKFHDIKGLR
ncbi:hypothetical protein CWO89_40670 [Bradyrhizobium sp. Leo170]|nr:hypothetical protein CWO89_40670 [Bradyrhizobium sp. Leo170]